jgi:hypothetical protein
MGNAGTSSGRFDRAVRSRNATAALSAAAELPTMPLHRALELVLVLRAERDERFPRAASRWIERWLLETEAATVDEVHELAQAFVHVDDGYLCARLGAIFDARAQRALKRVSDQWVPKGT